MTEYERLKAQVDEIVKKQRQVILDEGAKSERERIMKLATEQGWGTNIVTKHEILLANGNSLTETYFKPLTPADFEEIR